MKKIYSDIPRQRTKREFIKKVFRTGNLKTYKDKDKKKYQCGRNRRRSVHDLWLVCKTEYPSLTLKELGTVLKELINNTRDKNKSKTFICFCTDIQKYTWYNNYYNYIGIDERGFINTLPPRFKKYDKNAIGFKSKKLVKILS